MSIEDKSVDNGFDSTTGNGDNAPFIEGQLVPVNISYSIIAGPTQGVSTCEVTVIVQDGHGKAVPQGTLFTVWLSDNATGVGLTGVTVTNLRPKSNFGELMGTLAVNKALIVQTLGDGTFILEIRDNAKPFLYIAVESSFSALPIVSRQLITSDYGNSV